MNGGLSDEEYQRILAANPGWQAEEDERGPVFERPSFVEEDLTAAPAARAAQPAAPAAFAPAGAPAAQPAEGLRFFDKPDSEQYLDGAQKKALKSKLYAYLADKMQRRGEVTSKPYYDAAEKGFAHQERVSDANALGGLILNAGDRAGTVLGRGPASNFGQFSEALDQSRQTRIGNMRALRGMEEQANMNDLQVAQYLTGLERGDEARQDRRKALYEQMLLRKQQAEMARERMGFQNQMAQDRFGLEKQRHAELERHNRANEEIARNRPGSAPSMQRTDVLGPEGLPLNFKPSTGEYVKPSYPAGSKLAPKGGGKLTEGQWKAAQYADKMARSSAKIEELITKGYQPQDWKTSFRRWQPNQDWRNSEDQLYIREMLEFGAAVLRDETGAAFSDSEKIDVAQRYFPSYGDKPESIARKKAAREALIDGLKAEAAGAYDQILKERSNRTGVPAFGAEGQLNIDGGPRDTSQKEPEEMTDEERQAELERLRKAAGAK